MSKSKSSLEFCYMSLSWSYKSLSEINIIINHKSQNKNPISKSSTFKFYSITLHYMFVLELTKLLETNFKRRNSNYSSLFRLISLLKSESNQIESSFDEIIVELKKLCDSKYFKKIRKLRDEKIGHSDRDFELGPLSFSGFSKNEIEDGFSFLYQLNEIFNKIICNSEGTYFPSIDRKTEYFMKFYEEYEEFSNSKDKEFFSWKLNNEMK